MPAKKKKGSPKQDSFDALGKRYPDTNTYRILADLNKRLEALESKAKQ